VTLDDLLRYTSWQCLQCPTGGGEAHLGPEVFWSVVDAAREHARLTGHRVSITEE
jgi:hypothetical protein